jgi:threonine dehydrogenase-like Zn-dependent dehydrogenase
LTERRGPTKEDTQLVLGLWREGGLNTDILVGRTLPFEKYAEGIEALIAKKATKIYFSPA